MGPEQRSEHPDVRAGELSAHFGSARTSRISSVLTCTSADWSGCADPRMEHGGERPGGELPSEAARGAVHGVQQTIVGHGENGACRDGADRKSVV